MPFLVNRLILVFCAFCILSCDRSTPIEEEALVAQLLHVDSTLSQAAPRLAPEITMLLPASTEDTIIVYMEQEKGCSQGFRPDSFRPLSFGAF